jgi:RND family efflux transporter MFP subunit
VESRVGFQVAGRITSRSVEVGQRVQRGQTLAALDAADYQLGATAARAQVESAKVDRDQQRVDYKRFEDLARQGFISGADLERRKAQLDAAEARYNAAVAQADVSGNQAGYSTLKAPTAGVITAVEAEVGQVVTAGQAVVRIAQTEEKEVAIALPESRLEILRRIPEVKVTLWAGEGELRGRVREIAPLADAATRTYPARITLINAPPNVALGMTATVRFEVPLPQPLVTLPLQALLREGDSTYVWLLEQGSQQVKKSRIEVADVAGNDVVIRSGVMPGATVVTAGVHLLKEGQKVRVLEAEAGPTPATATTTKVPGSSTPQGGSQGKE